MGDPLLDDLDESQRAAVTSDAAPLAVVAPAGSGKTRVLTRRIAFRAREGRLDTDHVLAVTFTRKAAGVLRRRLTLLGVAAEVTAGTFHALALAQLRRLAAEAGREAPALLDAKARLLAGGIPDRATRTLVAGEIEWAKVRLVAPADYEAATRRAGRRPGLPAGRVADLYGGYELEKRRRRLLDFEDLLWRCAEAIETDAGFAASQRWRFRHLFVDEFQDVNPLQLRLLRAWLGDRDDLTVVGDGDQAIYGFAGSDAAALLRFTEHFPGGQTLRLAVNYRSTPQVVAASAAALATTGPGARTVRPDGPVPRVSGHPDEVAEARAVARLLEAARRGGLRYSEMAVLFRTNGQAAAFEDAFRRARLPFRAARPAPFTARPEFRAVLDALGETDKRAPRRPFTDHLADMADMAHLGAATDAPGDDDDRDGRDDDRDERDALPHRGADDPGDGRAGYDDRQTPEVSPAYAEAAATLLTWGREYLAAEGSPGSLAGFAAWLSLTARDAREVSGQPADAVDLLTFHRAKGLEWRLVCVTGVEDGLVPISYATGDDSRAEERRLLHVALGRAVDELHVSWAASRKGAARRVSPWLEAVAGASPPGPADRVPDPRRALAEARAVLAARQPPGSRPAG